MVNSTTLPELTGLGPHLDLPRTQAQGGKGVKLTQEQRERLAARTQETSATAPIKRMYHLHQVPVKMHQGSQMSQPQVRFSLPAAGQEMGQVELTVAEEMSQV